MGAFELILILAVVMIIFGAGKLPSVMRDLGKGVKAFRDGMDDEKKSDLPVSSPTTTTVTPANTAIPGAAPPTPISPPLPPTE